MNYTKLLATVSKLITKNGRAVTLYGQDKATLVNSNRPWLGVTADIDPTDAEDVLETFGVIVPPNTVRQFGLTSLGEGVEFKNLLAFSENVIIVPGAEVDFKKFNFVRDGNVDYGIKAIQILRPAEVTMLAFLGVRR
jgi:hypothetical protein